MFLNHFELGVVFHAGDEIDTGLGPYGEQPIVVVAPVIDHDSARCKLDLMGGTNVMYLALGDETKAWQVPIVVEHQMQLDRPFGAAKLGPVVHRQAQIDDGRVETDQLVLETEFLPAHRSGRDRGEQPVEHLFKQLPRSMAVGVGQRRAGGRLDAQVGQLAFATLQTAFNFPQGMGAAQLAGAHRDELAPDRQSFAAIFRASLPDDAFKVAARNELEYLAEHAA